MLSDSNPTPIRRWQTIGYPIFAEFVASDNELLLLRSFKSLTARVLLGLQDEICRLESDLAALDKKYMSATEAVNNGSFRREVKEDRRALLNTIKDKLKYYHEFVILHAKLRSRPPVEERQITNIINWHFKNEGAILNEEKDYILEEDDLIPIVPCAKSPLQRVLQKSKWFSTSSLFRRNPRKRTSYDEETIYYQHEQRVRIFDTMLVLTIALSMIIIPIWILYSVKDTKARLAIITAFITLFLFLVQIVTAAGTPEIVAATAAYSTVLMVFVQAST